MYLLSRITSCLTDSLLVLHPPDLDSLSCDPGVFSQLREKVGYFCNFRLFEG
jgi:hypothetical protein